MLQALVSLWSNRKKVRPFNRYCCRRCLRYRPFCLLELPQWTLVKGTIVNRRQDFPEYRWMSFKRYAEQYAFWLLAHIFASEIVRILWPMVS